MCVQKCFSEYGMRLNIQKLKFMVLKYSYLGNKLSEQRAKPIREKVASNINIVKNVAIPSRSNINLTKLLHQ